jgi:hypothetical protein
VQIIYDMSDRLAASRKTNSALKPSVRYLYFIILALGKSCHGEGVFLLGYKADVIRIIVGKNIGSAAPFAAIDREWRLSSHPFYVYAGL